MFGLDFLFCARFFERFWNKRLTFGVSEFPETWIGLAGSIE